MIYCLREFTVSSRSVPRTETPSADARKGVSSPETASRWRVVQRVADSRYFSRSPKLRGFLLFACENALLGRQDRLREQVIGHEVFGRSADYNTGEDNVVRVEARELRKRLAKYFSSEGTREPFVIEVPKGGYAPVFHDRDGTVPPESPEPVGEPAAPGRTDPRRRRAAWTIGVLSVAGILVMAVAAMLWQDSRTPSTFPESLGPLAGGGDSSFYAELLGGMGQAPGREALLVLSNPRVLLYSGSSDRESALQRKGEAGLGPPVLVPPSLEAALANALNPIDRGYPHHLLRATRITYTGMGEAECAFHIGRLLLSLSRKVRLTQGRFLTWDVAQNHDVIVLGSPQINEWTFKNLPESNFAILKGKVRNSEPQPAEQPEYVPENETGYALMCMSTLPAGYRILTLAGLSSAGTGAMGELLADPARMRPIYERLRTLSSAGVFPANWEVLARTTERDNVVIDVVVEALRVHPEPS